MKLTCAERGYQWNYGMLGQRLFEASEYFAGLLRKGLKFTDGHEPKIRFKNITRVMHVDTVVYDARSKKVHAVCEVKTSTDPKRRDFQLHGVGPEVIASAQHLGIPTFLAVVRLKDRPPESIHVEEGLEEYFQHLLRNPNEYALEFYAETEFELRGTRAVIKRQVKGASV